MLRYILDKTAYFRVLFFTLTQPFLNLLYKKKALELLNKRSGLSLNNIEKLTKNIPITYYFSTSNETEKFNDHYGIARVLKKYAKLPDKYPIKAHVEHAIAFTDYLFAAESKCAYSSIILCGDYRENILKRSGLKKNISKIGPYIHYSPPYYDQNEFNKEKNRLGHNILVLPVHSVKWLEVRYDIDALCLKLLDLKKKKKFKTIRICLYWKDAKLVKIYQNYGFEVVTAGHMFDPLFLPRLRSLIELSSLVVSNGIGTHLGYALALNKPFFLIRQNINREDEKNQFNKDFTQKCYKSSKLTQAFVKYSNKITPKQKYIANYYCGFNYIKTPEELKEILTRK